MKTLFSPGGALFIAALLALAFANSPLAPLYSLFIETPLSIQIGTAGIEKPLLLWINDGLMTIFFFMIGLELKREFKEGELKDKRNISLPFFAALGGMLVPSAIYWSLNYQDPQAINGWAIPAATDIAFAMGVLALFGTKTPLSWKVLLTCIAIFDDVGAILIIAFFFTSNLSVSALLVASLCFVGLTVLKVFKVSKVVPYILVGIVMWHAMLQSGVHATLAGVLLAAFIPMRDKQGKSPLKEMEHQLHPWVSYLILPVFAFANAGLAFQNISMETFTHPITFGIVLGLLVGKPLGILLFSYGAVALRWASLPRNTDWTALLGLSALCGIGFTMSLFIGSLAFEETGVNNLFDERVGILMGSFLSGSLGYFILSKKLAATAPRSQQAKVKRAKSRAPLFEFE